MDPLNPEINELFERKDRRRRLLAALPWPEKVRLLVRMQRMIVPLVRQRDPRARVWEIPDGNETSPDLK